jgi:hypothetical protein
VRLDKLAQALTATKDTFGLDSTDLMVLDFVVRGIKERKQVTIMEVVDHSGLASPATIHARIKKLCDGSLLKKVEHPTNMRYKVLEKGDNFDGFLTVLAEV